MPFFNMYWVTKSNSRLSKIQNQIQRRAEAIIEREETFKEDIKGNLAGDINTLGVDLLLIAKSILRISRFYCPIATGKLRRSAKVTQKDNAYEISYNTSYAVYVHEIISYFHRKPTRSKFLEDAVYEILQLVEENGYTFKIKSDIVKDEKIAYTIYDLERVGRIAKKKEEEDNKDEEYDSIFDSLEDDNEYEEDFDDYDEDDDYDPEASLEEELEAEEYKDEDTYEDEYEEDIDPNEFYKRWLNSQ